MLTHFLIVFAIWWEQFVYQSNANFLLNDDLILFLPSVLEEVFKISPHLIIADFWSLFLIILTNLTLLIVYTYIRARVSQVSIGSQLSFYYSATFIANQYIKGNIIIIKP